MAKDLKLDGTHPTLLYGYGGFEVSLRPSYSATIGKNWLEQGGVYVLSTFVAVANMARLASSGVKAKST